MHENIKPYELNKNQPLLLGQEMQTEWKKLRDIFNRTLKKVVDAGTDGQVTWRYWPMLQFIAENEKCQLYKCVQKWLVRLCFLWLGLNTNNNETMVLEITEK